MTRARGVRRSPGRSAPRSGRRQEPSARPGLRGDFAVLETPARSPEIVVSPARIRVSPSSEVLQDRGFRCWPSGATSWSDLHIGLFRPFSAHDSTRTAPVSSSRCPEPERRAQDQAHPAGVLPLEYEEELLLRSVSTAGMTCVAASVALRRAGSVIFVLVATALARATSRHSHSLRSTRLPNTSRWATQQSSRVLGRRAVSGSAARAIRSLRETLAKP
jgi:hypothetical protein